MSYDYPTFCYVGPEIGPSLGGPALLYKLLRDYPRGSFVSVEMQTRSSEGVVMNPGRTFRIRNSGQTWGPRAYTLFELTFTYGRRAWTTWLARKLRKFDFEAVVCVIHGWICEVALALARKRKVPFHAIIHDHPSVSMPAPRFLHAHRTRRWTHICREANSRLCVSPYMAEEVERLSGRSCAILYPGLRSGIDLTQDSPMADRLGAHGVSFAFVGSLHLGYEELVRNLATVLAAEGHRLVLHSPRAAELVRTAKLKGLENGGWIESDRVAETLHREADVLFLPMSFRQSDAANMRVLFPSKLAEYCAAGRPVLIWGPPYSSAVRWAREHSGFAEVVETESCEAIRGAIRRLEAPSYRHALGARALGLAREFFSHERTFGLFLSALRRTPLPVVESR